MLDSKVVFTVFQKQLFLSDWQQLRVIPLAGDASSRQYFRLKIEEQIPEKSWVLQVAEKFDESDHQSHPFLAAQKIFEACRVPVPKVLGQKGSEGWILLEDLGDATLQTVKTMALYKKAITAIVQLHLWADPKNPKIQSTAAIAPHFGWSFDFEKLNFEMGFTAENLFEGFLKINSDNFRMATMPNSRFLSDCPRFFCHRDYHSRNIMVSKDSEKISLIDFQDARMGPITYDLVSLLWDPYVPLSDGWREQLLKFFLSEVEGQKNSPQYHRALEALEDSRFESSAPRWQIELHRMIVQRMLKAAGSYASFFIKKGRTDYLPSVYPALVSARQALEALRDTAPQAWIESDVELLTSIDLAISRLPDNLKV